MSSPFGNHDIPWRLSFLSKRIYASRCMTTVNNWFHIDRRRQPRFLFTFVRKITETALISSVVSGKKSLLRHCQFTYMYRRSLYLNLSEALVSREFRILCSGNNSPPVYSSVSSYVAENPEKLPSVWESAIIEERESPDTSYSAQWPVMHLAPPANMGLWARQQ